MIIKEAQYKKVKVEQNKLIEPEVYGCDECGSEMEDSNEATTRLEVTIFHYKGEDDVDRLYFCSWGISIDKSIKSIKIMKAEFRFELGQRVRDKVSGLEGIIDGVAIWLNGCKRYSVQPPMDGHKKPDSWWIDEIQLEFIDEGIHVKVKEDPIGGPSSKSTMDK